MSLPRFDDFAYLVTTEYPIRIFKYYALKNGEVREFDNRSEAEQFSPLIEVKVINKDAADAQLDEYRKQHTAKAVAFKNACREYFTEVNDLVFELCWGFSEQEHHSGGYDEVANGLYDIVEFAERVVAISKGA